MRTSVVINCLHLELASRNEVLNHCTKASCKYDVTCVNKKYIFSRCITVRAFVMVHLWDWSAPQEPKWRRMAVGVQRKCYRHSWKTSEERNTESDNKIKRWEEYKEGYNKSKEGRDKKWKEKVYKEKKKVNPNRPDRQYVQSLTWNTNLRLIRSTSFADGTQNKEQLFVSWPAYHYSAAWWGRGKYRSGDRRQRQCSKKQLQVDSHIHWGAPHYLDPAIDLYY